MKRILEGDGTELERRLVASGRAARPNRAAKLWTSLAILAVSAGAAPGIALAMQNALRHGIVAKWLAIGLGIGAATWGGAHLVHHDAEARSAAIRLHAPLAGPSLRGITRLAATPPQPADAEAASDGEPPAPPIGAKAAALAPSAAVRERAVPDARSPHEISSPSVSAEIRELDLARRAIATGDPRGALDRLDRYAKSHSKGALEQEQLVLRIEALAALRDMGSARALARRFLVLYPQSAHRKRVQSLVGWQQP